VREPHHRPRRPHSTDLTDAQWRQIAPLIPPARPGGRPRSANLREVINAIRYWRGSASGWRQLPREFPPWGTVHYYYRRWTREGLWQRIEERLSHPPAESG
jgi:putative transposase